jgi:hypothetical protein
MAWIEKNAKTGEEFALNKKVFNKGQIDMNFLAYLEISATQCRLEKDYSGWCDVVEAWIGRLSPDLPGEVVTKMDENVRNARLMSESRVGSKNSAREILTHVERELYSWEHKLDMSVPTKENYAKDIDQDDLPDDDPEGEI